MTPAPATFEDWVELARTCVHGWHEEEVLYPYDNPHFSAAWGHFSQMVWRNSSRVGCALGHCEDEGDNKVNYPARIYCCTCPYTLLADWTDVCRLRILRQ